MNITINSNGNIYYYILELIELVEKKTVIKELERWEVIMIYIKQIINMFYFEILEYIKSNFNNTIDFYIYKIILIENRNYILNRIEEEYKKINKKLNDISLQDLNVYIRKLKKYFYREAIKNFNSLLKLEKGNIKTIKTEIDCNNIKKLFNKLFNNFIENLNNIFVQYFGRIKDIEKDIKSLINKIIIIKDKVNKGDKNETK